MYTSVTKVKTYLGITDTSYDSIIASLVSDADVQINSTLDIDGFDSKTTTETIRNKNVYVYTGGYYRIKLKNFNVDTLDKINGTDYTWTKGINEDYFIDHSRILYVQDLYNYLDDNEFNRFQVTYTYGGDVPDDIKRLAMLTVAAKFRREHPLYALGQEGQIGNISSYKLGDEQINFSKEQSLTADQSLRYNAEDNREIDRILKKYKKYHVV